MENVGSVVSARVATGERDANGVRGESESCAGADGAPGSIAQRPHTTKDYCCTKLMLFCEPHYYFCYQLCYNYCNEKSHAQYMAIKRI